MKLVGRIKLNKWWMIVHIFQFNNIIMIHILSNGYFKYILKNLNLSHNHGSLFIKNRNYESVGIINYFKI